MNVETIYRRRRKADRWEPARTALAVARMLAAAPAFWNASTDPGEVEAAEWREGGYQLRAAVLVGRDADTSFLGEFTDTWEPGAVSNADSTTWDACKWFIPANPCTDEDFDAYRRQGRSKAEARQRCAEVDRQAMLDAREPEAYGVTVTASLGGRVLGESSCWSIFDDYPHLAYVAEVARECAADAIREADATLARRLGTAREVIA